MKILFILLFCCVSAFADLRIEVNPVVQTPTGSYRGLKSISQFGRNIYSFYGIPYGVAPTGHQRFKPAIMVEPHHGIIDATQHGPLCPQPVTGNKIISEDCLRLNVFTTKLPSDPSYNSSLIPSHRPVVVFLHPGNFATGSSYELGPEVMLIKDIILVTVNYRLGALGFLSIDDERAPGNAGLKDQVLALRWIKQNIAAFGGDPNKVTLGGLEAGAWSVSLHIASPLSRGLFHRAFIIGGAAPLYKPLPTNQLDLAKRQAQDLKCPIDTIDNMINCLYTKTPEEFGNSILRLADVNLYSRPLYTPVIELGNGHESFLNAQPLDIIRQGLGNFVPFVTGFDIVDFNNITDPTSINSASLNQFNEKFTEIAPRRFGYEFHPQANFVTNELRNFYLKGQSVSLETCPQFGELYDDALSIYPVHYFERLMAAHSTEPVFNYFNAHLPCDRYPNWSNGTDFISPQKNELTLLFNVNGHPTHCPNDAITVHQIMEMIENFMEFSRPIPEHKAHIFPIIWKPSTATAPCYMEYGKEMKFVNGFRHPERMNKWDGLFKTSPIHQ